MCVLPAVAVCGVCGGEKEGKKVKKLRLRCSSGSSGSRVWSVHACSV